MINLTRRSLAVKLSSLIVAGSALTACKTISNSDGSKSYEIDINKINSILASVTSGVSEIISLDGISNIIGNNNIVKINSYLKQINSVASNVAASTSDTLTVTVAKQWMITANSCLSAIIAILKGFSNIMPAKVNDVVNALAVICPVLLNLVGAVTTLDPSTEARVKLAQKTIANGI